MKQPKIDRATEKAIQDLLERNWATGLDDMVKKASDLAWQYRSYALDELQTATTRAMDLTDGHGHMTKGGKTRIREAKTAMAQAKRELDRVAFWDSIRVTAQAMIQREELSTRVYQ